MSELEFGIRVRADASGLVGQLGEGSSAADDFGQSVERVNERVARAGSATGSAQQQLRGLSAESAVAAGAQRRLTSETDAAATAQARAADATGAQRAGYQQLGAQLNDIVTQLAMGTSPLTVFAQQGSQVLRALSLIGAAGATAGKGMGETAQAAEQSASAVETVKSTLGEAKTAYDDTKGAIDEVAAAFGIQTAAQAESSAATAADTSATSANTGATGVNTTATGANTGATGANAVAEAESAAAKAADTTATTANSAATGANTAATGANTAAAGANAATTGVAAAAKARFASLLAGPWSAAVIGGVTLLGLLAGKLLESEEASEDLSDAQEVVRQTLEELREAIEDQSDALERQLQTTREAQLAAVNQAELHRQEILRRRQITVAALEEAQAIQRANIARATGPGGTSTDVAAAGIGPGQRRIDELEAQLRQAKADLNAAEQGVQRARTLVLRDAVEEGADPRRRIQGQFDRARRSLEEELEQAVQLGGDRAAAEREYSQALRRLTAERDAELRRLQQRTRRPDADLTGFIAPVSGGRQSAPFGERRGNRNHAGVDIAVPVGTGVRAPAAGTIIEIGNDPGGYGNFVVIDHGRGTTTRYAHLLRINRREGQQVGQGEVFAQSGGARGAPGAGNSRGPHLHYEVRLNRRAVNPNTGRFPADEFEVADRADEILERLERQRQELEEWGRRAGDRLASVRDSFSEEPQLVVQTREELRELDRLLAEIEQRRPPNYQQLKDEIAALRPLIADSVDRPYREYLEAQGESLELLRLERAGLSDQAEARQIILRLEQQMGPLTQERRDAVLATVQALKAEQRQIEILRASQQKYLNALGQVRSSVTNTISATLSGDLEALADLPDRLRRTFNELVADYLTESLFGDTFRQLEDQVTGTRIVEDASQRMSEAVSATAPPLADLARSADAAAAALGQVATAGQDGWPAGEAPGGPAAGGDAAPDMVVTASRLPRDPVAFFENVLTRLAEGIFGDRAARAIGQVVSRGLQGAAYGSIAGSVAGLVGLPTDRNGSAIGGALGNIAGEQFAGAITTAFGSTIGGMAGPLGSIVGGLIGSVAGSLLSGPQKASATITSVDGAMAVTGKSGLKGAASALGGSVQQALAQIAETLGGQVGGFAVSIGKRGDSFRVDPSGRGQTKARGVLAFDNEAAAVAAAIADAVKDGAVTGLSAAVQAALRSSNDIDKALKEALKVDALETLLSGTAGELNKLFKDFERQAAERVRIARQYGFDLVKLEELNAKERAKIFDDALSSRVGQLRDLLDDLNFGDLFEGSIVDRREKLLTQIAREEGAARAGTEGAADRVAELRRELLELTRSGFGTAGAEFAADRAGTVSAAEEIIRIENDRIKAAQDTALGTNQRLDTNNQLTNETNDLLAEQNALLRQLGVAGSAGGGGGGGEAFSTRREVALR